MDEREEGDGVSSEVQNSWFGFGSKLMLRITRREKGECGK